MRQTWSKRFGGMLLGATIGTAAFAADLVTINLEPIREDIAKDIKVDVGQIPAKVQAPAGIAAKVCNVSVEFLGTQASSGATCDGRTPDDQLNQELLKQIKANQKK